MVHVRTDEEIARAFADTFRRMAPVYGLDPCQALLFHPWERMPENHRRLMQATARSLCEAGVISRPLT